MDSRIRFAVAVAVLGLAAEVASSQGPVSSGNRPAVSPYLNLLRGGNPTFLNYYGTVRPQLDAQQAFQSLQGQVQTLGATQAAAVGIDGQPLPVTGVPFGYFSHRAYFLNNRSGSGGGGTGYGGVGGGFGGAGGGGFNRGINSGGGAQIPRPQGVR